MKTKHHIEQVKTNMSGNNDAVAVHGSSEKGGGRGKGWRKGISGQKKSANNAVDVLGSAGNVGGRGQACRQGIRTHERGVLLLPGPSGLSKGGPETAVDDCMLDVVSCVCRCNTLQHTLRHTAIHCNTLQHTAMHCNTLQHTATHCNTLQHAATHCSTFCNTKGGVAYDCRLDVISCVCLLFVYMSIGAVTGGATHMGTRSIMCVCVCEYTHEPRDWIW